MEKIFSYFQQYQTAVLLSLAYFMAAGYIGLSLILRRASLFGLVLSQVAQVSFLLGLALAAQIQGHEHVYAMINRSGASGGDWHFLEIDMFVVPITLLLLVPFVYFAIRGSRNKETLLVLGLLLALAAYPLINKVFGGTDVVLAKAYFTEILYTPSAMFIHYLPAIALLVSILVLYQRKFMLSGFDPVQARLNGINTAFSDALFYFLSGIILSFVVRVVGAYVAMAVLIVPGFVSLSVMRTMRGVLFLSILLALLLPAMGFVFAFRFDSISTEPFLTVFVICAGGAILLLRLSILTFRPRRNGIKT